MLRSIHVVKSWTRDHVTPVITSSRLANGTHFNADRQFRQTWRQINSSSPVVITSSRAHDMNGTRFHRSWTREHEFTTWKERSITHWLRTPWPTPGQRIRHYLLFIFMCSLFNVISCFHVCLLLISCSSSSSRFICLRITKMSSQWTSVNNSQI